MKSALMFLTALFVLLAIVAMSMNTLLNEKDMDSIDGHYKKGLELYGKGDWKAAAAEFNGILEKNPGDDIAIYMIATILSKANDPHSSLNWLKKLQSVKSCLAPIVSSFAAINKLPEFRSVAEDVARRAAKTQHSEVAAVVSQKDLTPEGIAYDPQLKTVFLSSLYRRKIVSVQLKEAGAQPVIDDFTTEAQDGFYCGLGMKVDVKRRQLWACSSAENIMHGYSKEDEGKSAVFVYDLNSRKLIQKFPIGPKPPHLLNDLALSPDGSVFVTDTVSGEIFKIRQAGTTLETLVQAGSFSAPNGIAISDDGKHLYVADSSSVVSLVNPENGSVKRLPQAIGIAPVFIDGLYFHKGSLIGIENVISGGRVARFFLNSTNDAIVRSEVMDCNNPHFRFPTTGALGDGWFFYIANSQFGSFKEDGSILPLDQLRDVVILKSRL